MRSYHRYITLKHYMYVGKRNLLYHTLNIGQEDIDVYSENIDRKLRNHSKIKLL